MNRLADLTCKVEPAQLDALKAEAQRRRVSLGVVVREILETWCEVQGGNRILASLVESQRTKESHAKQG